MPHEKKDRLANEIARVLGEEIVTGFHVEWTGYRSLFWDGPHRGDGTRFPCIDDQNRYSGCLGAQCTAKRCWAGDLVPSAVRAAGEAPLPSLERRGSTCHTCTNVADAADGLVQCALGHFDQPVTVSCLLRRRVPESVPVPCEDYTRARALRPEVEEYRRRKREMLARRRPAVRAKAG